MPNAYALNKLDITIVFKISVVFFNKVQNNFSW